MQSRSRWPHLSLEGVHAHVGSQILEIGALESSLAFLLEFAAECARRGAPLSFVNAGGGFGIDYEGLGREFPIERWAERLASAAHECGLSFVIEPGRWLVGPCGWLVAEVLGVKERDGRRFVTVAAGMNDLIRPALYQARHRIAIAPRGLAAADRERPASQPAATIVGPVCESADCFADGLELPDVQPGELMLFADAGAYGASMSSNYNGRGRLAELVAQDGKLVRARAGETARDLLLRRSNDVLPG
jgi:diaminopimelate decarboxylase